MIHKRKEYRIWQRHNHIARRKRICNNHKTFSTYTNENGQLKSDFSKDAPMEWYKHDGQYNKGKIHCSCKMCKFSRHFGLPTLRDIKEMQKFEDSLNDYFESA